MISSDVILAAEIHASDSVHFEECCSHPIIIRDHHALPAWLLLGFIGYIVECVTQLQLQSNS